MPSGRALVGTSSAGPRPNAVRPDSDPASRTPNPEPPATGVATSANFGQTNNCGGGVAARGSCTINVTFLPAAAGSLAGALTVTDNSNGVAGSRQTVTLRGTGTNSVAR
jgi:hypothetical protein